MQTTKEDKTLWLTNLSRQINELIKELELSPQHGEKIKDLVFVIARTQYQAGNKAGIRWAIVNREEE